ncbi:putative d- protein [Rosellinia necatrix]|uniref:Putative d-protein n=1 Tax=Rosellinia necatrix TaxID=77044 RepID=A0A1W2TTX4_ROSNE|nr:putative d- protein [Rosellinia necatrix]
MADSVIEKPTSPAAHPLLSPKPLADLLQPLNPQITELVKIAGTAGLSLGVYRHGEPTYYANFGFRDVAAKLPVTEQTIFAGCSLTKLFTAFSMARIIDDEVGNVTWGTRIKDVLPDFSPADFNLREQMTIADVLSHRTGMSLGDFYLGSENNIVVAHEDSIKFLNDQVPINPFRGQMQYNNLGYEIAGLVIDKVSGSWADMFRQKLFQPLGMQRTFTGRPPQHIENVAKAYNTLDDCTPVEIPLVKAGEGVIGGSSGGMFTCVEDLLKAYTEIVNMINNQFRFSGAATKESPLRRVADIISAKIPMNQPTMLESSYAFGLVRVELPGALGQVGLNPGLMPDGKMPIAAKGTPSRLILYHQGSLPGALSAIAMIPELEVVVVVMTNSLSLNDCSDWVLQLVLEQLLDSPQRNDYIAAAQTSADQTLQWYGNTVSSLDDERKNGTAPKALEAYVGTYWNKQRYLKVDVTINDGRLYWALQGLDSEKFELDHFDGDVFLWLRPRNYMAQRGRWVDNPPIFWKIRFNTNKEGIVTVLNWAHDPNIPSGEDFYKDA